VTPSPSPTAHHARLIRKLESIGFLTPEEKAALAGLPLDVRSFPAGADLVREGDEPSQCCLIVDGLAARYKLTGEGQRQIMSFHWAGDVPDLQSLHLRQMDHSVGAITRTTAAFIHHDAIHRLIAAYPGIGSLLWRDTLIDAAIFREWLTGVGRRSAYARIAHLICELFMRARAVGLTHDNSLELPITQAELGDALGLSSVHVNRVLQELRGDGLIQSQGRMLVIADWPGLEAAGDFDPTYLHIQKLAA
jgi:CRP-like cAMP-binding protein